MSVFDSDLSTAEIDVKGIRSDFVRTKKLFDAKNRRAQDGARLRENLYQYITYIAANLDSDNVGAQEFDSDDYGVPAGWDRFNGNIFSGASANWSKLRGRLGQSQRAWNDGGSRTYAGAPSVIVTADSDERLVYNHIDLLLKAHFADWLASDTAERHKINTALNTLTANDTLLGQLTDKLVGAYDSDRSAYHDLFFNFLKRIDSAYPGVAGAPLGTHRSALTINDAVTSPFFKFNQYALLIDDSDTDAQGRGKLWKLRRQLATIVLNGIQFDSEFGGGEGLNFGRNRLLGRLGAIQDEFVRRAAFTHLSDITTRFYNWFDYQWVKRDSDNSGNLTTTDAKGYTLGYDDHVVPGFQTDNIDDSEQILNYIKRIEFFATFWAERFGATDSDKLENIYDSEYTKAISTTSAGLSGRSRSNYYHYHPSFLARFKDINRGYVDKILVDGYLAAEDSDWTHYNRGRLWERLSQYLTIDDSAAAALYTRLLNVANEDSDLGVLQGDTTITTVAGLDSEDLQDADGLQLFLARQTVNIIDSDSELQQSLARNIAESFIVDSDTRGSLFLALQNDSDRMNTLLDGFTEDIYSDLSAFIDADSDIQKTLADHTVESIINDSDLRMNLTREIRADFVEVMQEHVVHDSESSYTSFTFYVPRDATTNRLIYNLPTNNGPDASMNIRVYLNGLLLSSAVSYDESGKAKVNSNRFNDEAPDVSSVLVSTSEADPYVTVNFGTNVPQGDILQISYMTTIYR